MKNLILHLLLVVLMGVSGGVAGCALLTRDVQAKDSNGTLLYIGTDGKATDEPVAANGQPNPPLMLPESNGTLEGLQTVGAGLPAPFGSILGAVGGVATAALGAYLEAKRRKANALIDEYERAHDADPELAKARDAKWDSLSPALRDRLDTVKAKA